MGGRSQELKGAVQLLGRHGKSTALRTVVPAGKVTHECAGPRAETKGRRRGSSGRLQTHIHLGSSDVNRLPAVGGGADVPIV